MRTMSPSYDCKFFGFKEGQEGLFYDSALNILLRGKIVDFMLQAEVIHGGNDIPNGRYFSAFSRGYKYIDWDLQYITWFPENILTYQGYMDWINDDKVTEKEIKGFIKGKRLLDETLESKFELTPHPSFKLKI